MSKEEKITEEFNEFLNKSGLMRYLKTSVMKDARAVKDTTTSIEEDCPLSQPGNFDCSDIEETSFNTWLNEKMADTEFSDSFTDVYNETKMLNDPHFGKIIKLCWEVYQQKGNDYTRGTNDRTDNFYQAAEFAGLTPLQAWQVYSYKHYSAISAYVKNGGSVESEPIVMRIVDNINYLILLYAIVKKMEGESNE